MLRETWRYLNSLEFATPDPYTSKNFVCWSPFKMLLFDVFYLLFVYKVGPAFMENRKPYNLKKIMLLYNFAQMLLNCIAPINAFIGIVIYRAMDVGCMMTLPQDHPQKQLEVVAYSFYVLLKFVDYMDTVFFVLRKSTRQITFLHVYHHLLMANGANLYFRYYGYGGHLGFMGVLNSVVHIVMYYYYFASALHSSMKALWWKKYITIMQLSQFAIVFLHNLYPLIFRHDCQYPRNLLYFHLLQSVVMLYLFGKFYVNAYGNKTSSSISSSCCSSSTSNNVKKIQ